MLRMAAFEAVVFGTGTVSNAVQTLDDLTGISTADLVGPVAMRITVTGNTGKGLRYRYDSGNPSSSVGHCIAEDCTLELYGADLIQNFKMIRNTTDVVVCVTLMAWGG